MIWMAQARSFSAASLMMAKTGPVLYHRVVAFAVQIMPQAQFIGRIFVASHLLSSCRVPMSPSFRLPFMANTLSKPT
jgi:hypothetical protein